RERLRSRFPVRAAREGRAREHRSRNRLEETGSEEPRELHRGRAESGEATRVEPRDAYRCSVHYGSQILTDLVRAPRAHLEDVVEGRPVREGLSAEADQASSAEPAP